MYNHDYDFFNMTDRELDDEIEKLHIQIYTEQIMLCDEGLNMTKLIVSAMMINCYLLYQFADTLKEQFLSIVLGVLLVVPLVYFVKQLRSKRNRMINEVRKSEIRIQQNNEE